MSNVSERPGVQIAYTPPEVQSDIAAAEPVAEAPALIDLENVSVFYGSFEAVRGTTMAVRHNKITAMIGPSGCGKSTVLRCLNRMNDLVPGARVAGRITYQGQDLYAADVDAIQVRRRIGMVFQKPNPFPKSIFDNVAYGIRINKIKGNVGDMVEQALRDAALWDEVKDKLKMSGLALSGGQQQRLCIARTIAVRPDVILMDEPCSALDPIATAKIEDLMHELAKQYTIVIVTHNMQQAARVSDRTAFFTTEVDAKFGLRTGMLVEYDYTSKLFSNPRDERSERYITGRFG